MLLLKTILIFLKNKCEELNIVNNIRTLIIILLICSLMAITVIVLISFIGFLVYNLLPFFISFIGLDKVFINFAPVFNLITILKFCGLGFVFTLYSIFLIVCSLFISAILYFIYKIEYKQLVRDFVWFIKSNWIKANITSGRKKLYAICYKKKEEYFLITRYFSICRVEKSIRDLDWNIAFFVRSCYDTLEEAKEVIQSDKFKEFCKYKKIKKANIEIKLFYEMYKEEIK